MGCVLRLKGDVEIRFLPEEVDDPDDVDLHYWSLATPEEPRRRVVVGPLRRVAILPDE